MPIEDCLMNYLVFDFTAMDILLESRVSNKHII